MAHDLSRILPGPYDGDLGSLSLFVSLFDKRGLGSTA